MSKWRNGRRANLRYLCPLLGVWGSTPTFDTVEACVQSAAQRPAKPWPFGVSEFEALRFRQGAVVELVDTTASNPVALRACQFDSGLRH